MNLSLRSPLRYPGGKAKLVPFLVSILEKNNLLGKQYVEPYSGGAGIALGLLMNGLVSKIIINDIDKSIYSFWFSILHYTEKFCKKIAETNITVEEWNKQKAIQNNKFNEELFDLGFSTFFLNRTNRSGIIKAGIIGGKTQSGAYKIDCRFNKTNLIKKIKEIALHKHSIEIFNDSAENLIIDELSKIKKEEAFVYFDPPYFEKGCQLYENFYKPQDHSNLMSLITTKLKVPWLLTYDNVERIKQLYCNFQMFEIGINYSAALKRYASELAIIPKNTNMPNFDEKSGIKIIRKISL